MRAILTSSAAGLLLCSGAFAVEPTTLEYVTTKGVVMKVSGLEIPVTYTADGKYSALSGAITGVWRITGEQMCSKGAADPAEVCLTYPAGKKPGDEFELTGPQGPFRIKINQ